MWRYLVLSGWFASCAQAFSPASIRWGGPSAGDFVLAPKAMVSSQKLAIWDQSGGLAPSEIPHFRAKLDQTIAWDAKSLCVEAGGHKDGDEVRVNRCTGAPAQLWNIVPLGREQKNLIQLKDTSKCMDVNHKGGLNGAPVELRECVFAETAPWKFEDEKRQDLSALSMAIPFMSMVVLGALGISAWFWRWQKATHAVVANHGRVPVNGGQGGVSLSMPLATRHRRPDTEVARRTVPSMQAVLEKEELATWPSKATADLADVVDKMYSDGAKPDECNVAPHLTYWMRAIQVVHEDWHPVRMIRDKIVEAVNKRKPDLEVVERGAPVVTIAQNFDELLIPVDHPARGRTDTYYVTDELVLRTQMTAHHTELLRRAAEKLKAGSEMSTMLCTGEVYRKDTVDATHLPVHHQLEGISLWTKDESAPDGITDLKETLEAVVKSLYGEDSEIRWRDHELPYVIDGLELDVKVGDDWMELLGCGALQPEILQALGLENHTGWAWGLGLERLAMRKWAIPDIRWLWCADPKFVKQCEAWAEGGTEPCKAWSKFPACYKDVTLRLNIGEEMDEGIRLGDDGEVERAGPYHATELHELVRDVAGDRVEAITELLDKQYRKPDTDLFCITYRITYRSMDRTLTDDEVNDMQFRVRENLEKDMGLTLG